MSLTRISNFSLLTGKMKKNIYIYIYNSLCKVPSAHKHVTMEELTVRYLNKVQISSHSYSITFNEREANRGNMCEGKFFSFINYEIFFRDLLNLKLNTSQPYKLTFRHR